MTFDTFTCPEPPSAISGAIGSGHLAELHPLDSDALDRDPWQGSASDGQLPTHSQTVRVLHLINGEHYSGAERVQDLLAMGLPEFGFTADFACLKPGRFAACRQSHEAQVFDLPMHWRADLGPARKLARLVREHDYRVLHSHTPRAALVGRMAAALAGVPLVHHLHSPTACDSTHRWRNRFNSSIERLSLGRVAAVVAVSHSLGEYARQQGINPRLIHVVPNGVPVQGPLSERSAPAGTWTLGTVALFRPRKGLETLLEALALVRSQGLSVRLRAVGRFETPEYEGHICREIDRLQLAEQIDWIGFTRDVTGELARLDLLVLPSLFGEGLPMVVLEAMAAGVPVVATRVEGVCEAIRDGVDGLLVPAGAAEELAAAIARFVRGEVCWSTVRGAAHRRHSENYSDRSMAQGVAEVYRRVLS